MATRRQRAIYLPLEMRPERHNDLCPALSDCRDSPQLQGRRPGIIRRWDTTRVLSAPVTGVPPKVSLAWITHVTLCPATGNPLTTGHFATCNTHPQHPRVKAIKSRPDTHPLVSARSRPQIMVPAAQFPYNPIDEFSVRRYN